MLEFDMRALQTALDGERRARKLMGDQSAAEINEPFKHTPSIPISVGTLRTMTTKRSVTSAVVLQVLRWLRRTPESFLAGRDQNGVAKERAGLTPSMLTYLATGPLIGFPRVMVLTQWLGRSAADFVRARSE
jgi:hypothetical protein